MFFFTKGFKISYNVFVINFFGGKMKGFIKEIILLWSKRRREAKCSEEAKEVSTQACKQRKLELRVDVSAPVYSLAPVLSPIPRNSRRSRRFGRSGR